eukprot:TRINITY_DN8313_c0_g1_i1.p1 TRINITY_DN8313_c0_g1~~TRINITY_DN8313_c0_g1_i1.p1  ORF type:complete len:992 (+),score=173.88 TRINITY_DN8313_c0_g1_i1:178-3153(+)
MDTTTGGINCSPPEGFLDKLDKMSSHSASSNQLPNRVTSGVVSDSTSDVGFLKKSTKGSVPNGLLTEENLKPLSCKSDNSKKSSQGSGHPPLTPRQSKYTPGSRAQDGTILAKSDSTIHSLNSALRSHIFQPDDMTMWYWDTLLLFCVLYYGLFIPCQYSMQRDVLLAGETGHLILDLLCSLVFAVDILIRFNTAYLDDNTGMLVDTPSKVRWYYLKNGFLFDLLAALPLDLLCMLILGDEYAEGWIWLSLAHLRLFKFVAVRNFFKVITPVKLAPFSVSYQYTIVPMLRLTFYCALAVNFITVLWILLNRGGPRGSTEDQYSYITALYWTLYTVTSVGYGDIPVETDAKKLFASILFVAGVVIHGIVISKISSRMQKGDVESDRTDKMKETLSVLKKFSIPEQLACEVLAFQYHQLHSDVSGSFMKVLHTLPAVMRDRVGLFVRMRFICQVPMFKEQPIECLVGLANALKSLVLEPESRIIKAGDEGREMFFMGHGFADVTSPEGEKWGTIKPGGFFGEIALLTDSKRTASITTLTYCDLFRLDKGDFFLLIRKHPELRAAVQEEMIQRQIQQSLNGTSFKLDSIGPHDELGITWAYEGRGSGYVVQNVETHSAAARAGICQGMHLVSIGNGDDATAVDSIQMINFVEDVFQMEGCVELTLLPPTVLFDNDDAIQAQDSMPEQSNIGDAISQGNTPFVLDLSSTRDTMTSKVKNGSELSFGSDADSSPIRRKASRHKDKLPDITLNPPPVSTRFGNRERREMSDVIGRLSKLEEKAEINQRSVEAIEKMVEAMLNALDLVVEKDKPSTPVRVVADTNLNVVPQSRDSPVIHSFSLPDAPVPLPPEKENFNLLKPRPHSPNEELSVRSLQSLQEGASNDSETELSPMSPTGVETVLNRGTSYPALNRTATLPQSDFREEAPLPTSRRSSLKGSNASSYVSTGTAPRRDSVGGVLSPPGIEIEGASDRSTERPISRGPPTPTSTWDHRRRDR